jgi:hypothetical protein
MFQNPFHIALYNTCVINVKAGVLIAEECKRSGTVYTFAMGTFKPINVCWFTVVTY